MNFMFASFSISLCPSLQVCSEEKPRGQRVFQSISTSRRVQLVVFISPQSSNLIDRRRARFGDPITYYLSLSFFLFLYYIFSPLSFPPLTARSARGSRARHTRCAQLKVRLPLIDRDVTRERTITFRYRAVVRKKKLFLPPPRVVPTKMIL